MRIHRLLLATVAAVLAFAVVAVAQTTQYDIRGSVTVKGGTPKKPKPGGLSFGFTVSDPSGNQPAPLQTYSIAFEGGRMNTNLIPGCTAAQINANQGSDAKCPKGSKIGGGTLKAYVGATGQPIASAAPCDATLTLYNSRRNHVALFVKSSLTNCPASIHQAIDMTYFTKGAFSGLKFTVPNELRHQVGLDITVATTDVKINKITVKKGGRVHGFLESTGCKDHKRDLQVTFMDEQGQSFPVTKTLGAC